MKVLAYLIGMGVLEILESNSNRVTLLLVHDNSTNTFPMDVTLVKEYSSSLIFHFTLVFRFNKKHISFLEPIISMG